MAFPGLTAYAGYFAADDSETRRQTDIVTCDYKIFTEFRGHWYGSSATTVIYFDHENRRSYFDGVLMRDNEPGLTLTSIPHLASSPAALPAPLDQNPVAVYLASLGSGSRPTIGTALSTIADLFGLPERHDVERRDVRWMDVSLGHLHHYHTDAICTRPKELYVPATANKLLVALCGTMYETQQLGQRSAGDYNAVTDLGKIRARRQALGRQTTAAEGTALLQAGAEDRIRVDARHAVIIALLRGSPVPQRRATALDGAALRRSG